jgi:LmbE family N-acetylglucosaminyl deacetylase
MISEPAYSVVDARRVLVLAPHADDEALGCGGTIALCASKGAEVHVAAISDGGGMLLESSVERITIVEKRKRESLEASKILGVAHTYYLDFPDGELRSHKKEIKDRIDEIIVRFKPDIVLSPSPVDTHDDHITVSEIACELLARPGDMRVAFYEIYGSVRFNSLVDISDVVDIKERAVLAYRYSLFDVPEVFFEAAKGLNRFRSLHTRRIGYYEAFWILSNPVSTHEIISWITYGMRESDPAEVFLSTIRAVDEAFFELKKCADSLGGKEDRIRELETMVESSRRSVDELKMRLDTVQESLAWRMAIRFYKIRDRLLPQGSYFRKLYHNAVSVIKSDKAGPKRRQ